MSLQKSESLGENLKKLEIFVEPKEFAKACDMVYKRQGKRIKVPGFRVGKASKKVIEKMYGKDVFYSDAIDLVYKKALDDAIKELDLDVVALEEFNILSVDEDKGLNFSVNCVLKPKITVKEYKGFEVKRPIKKVTAKDVNDRIAALRERVAKVISIEDRQIAKNGDLVEIDFTGFIDGISFKGGTAKNYKLRLGSNQFVKGFEDQVKGHKVKEGFDIEVTFPKDYYQEALREKKVLFKCKLNSIKKVELPELNDDFAKDVSRFNTLAELKDNIKKEMEKENNDYADKVVHDQLLNLVVNNVSGDIPNAMYDREYEDIIKNFNDNMRRRGVEYEEYLDRVGLEEEDLRYDLQRQAVFQVKLRLAMEEISKVENIQATEKEIEDEMKNFAKDYKIKLEHVKNIFPVEILKKDIIDRKTIQFIKDNAKIIEKN